MTTGSILVEWDAQGRLNIKSSASLSSGEARKAAIDKLLDAARAINNQGTPLVMPATSGVRLLAPR